jgi:hypothetical protein
MDIRKTEIYEAGCWKVTRHPDGMLTVYFGERNFGDTDTALTLMLDYSEELAEILRSMR